MSDERLHELARKGCVHLPQFDQTVDELQRRGYKTELWVGTENITLRWISSGAKWHTTIRKASKKLREQIAELADHAYNWLKATESMTGDPSHHAVREG